MESTSVEVDETGDGGGGEKRAIEEEASVKQETPEKSVTINAEDVKKEPIEGSTGETERADSSGRSMRKRSMNSMAETSDLSEESADENISKPAKKRGRGSTASSHRSSSSRGRSRGKHGDDSNPRIALKNLEDHTSGDAGQTASKRPVGRPRRGRPPKTAAKNTRKSTPRKRAKVVVKDEDEDDDDEGFELDDDDDDEEVYVPKKKRGTRQSKPAPKRGGKGKGKGNKTIIETDEDDEEDDDDEDEDGTNDTSGDTSGSNIDAVMTGQYLIEKADMKRLENYPIWRMEGPNMLRKFEMTVVDGRVCHKSLYAYSSWAQSMADLYEKLTVTQISSQEGETVVEINEDCMPKPPDLANLENCYVGDGLLPLYYKYTQALFHHAIDPSFLKKIKSENDLYFLDAINQIDNIIREKITQIESQVNMKDDFKTRVRNCPNMKTIRRQNWSQTDQATTDKSAEKGVRSVLLFGYGYEPFSMDEDKSKGVEVAQEVVVGSTMDQYLAAYHGLIHFKYSMLKRCQDKVKLCRALYAGHEMAVILNRCLQDKVWILQTFEELKTLLAVGSVS